MTPRVAIALIAALTGMQAATPDDGMIRWTFGPMTRPLGGVAEVRLPGGCRITDAQGGANFLRSSHNLAAPNDLAVVACVDLVDRQRSWYLVYRFDPIGRVRDDDRHFDPPLLLATLAEGLERDNAERSRRGMGAMRGLAWEERPAYDSTSRRLTWAVSARDGNGDEVVTRSVRLLGRTGVLAIDAILLRDQLLAAEGDFAEVVGATRFVDGQRYDDWRDGDTVAPASLSALVSGGARSHAAKRTAVDSFLRIFPISLTGLFRLALVAALGVVIVLAAVVGRRLIR